MYALHSPRSWSLYSQSSGNWYLKRSSVFSPFAQPASIEYAVRTEGIVGLSDPFDVGMRGTEPLARSSSAWWRADDLPPTQIELDEWQPGDDELRALEQYDRTVT